MPKKFRVRHSLGAFALLLVTSAGCGDVREMSGVYREEFELAVPDDRAYAVRITIFEFEQQVGGWVEYYGQDTLNTPEAPFALPTYCAYFGPFRRVQTGMVMRAASPSPDEDLQLRFQRENRRFLSARVESLGGIFVENVRPDTPEIYFRLDRSVRTEGCPEAAELITRPLTGFRRGIEAGRL